MLPVNGCVTDGSDHHAAAEADNGGQVERVRCRERPMRTSKCLHFVKIIVIVEKVVNSFGTSYKYIHFIYFLHICHYPYLIYHSCLYLRNVCNPLCSKKPNRSDKMKWKVWRAWSSSQEVFSDAWWPLLSCL